MHAKRTFLQFAAVGIVAALSFGVARAVRFPAPTRPHATVAQAATAASPVAATPASPPSPVPIGQPEALLIMSRMYAAYAAMHSFRCNVTSREEPLGTAQDADYEIERPNKIRFRRFSLLGPEMSGNATAVSDGQDLYVTCTENHAMSDRYVKELFRSDSRDWFADFGGLPSWGTEPDAGMPDVALGIHLHNDAATPQISAPIYSLGKPTTIDFPGVPGPISLDVVIATMHWIQPVGTMPNDPEIVTYYIGRQDHLLYEVTGAYMVGPNDWDTRTETYNSIEINPTISPADFVFAPPAGSRPAANVSDLFPGGRM